ncbi:MAG: DUF1015 domain-containing protein [Chlorobiaceae bacterium]|nr:DUF1015 domain-containing protein [Chlorobiaceae bacterium]NTW73235.1 DUF1015 domain-containing protein [Chlorobiaceae bacterium]
MPEIVPFRGIVYGPGVIGEASRLICPPYDAIPPVVQQKLYDASPYNAVRMELPMEADPYAAAAGRLHEWLAEGVLEEDGEPAIYPCAQTFTDEQGIEHTRWGFFAALRLYDVAERQVLPHERTLSGPKADRLNMFRKTSANLSSIFGLYADESLRAETVARNFASTHEPIVDAEFQGVRNRLWRITDPGLTGQFQSTLAGLKVYIADGHHRYETGVAYRNERAAANPAHTGQEPYNYILAYLSNIHDEGLLILPIHRLVRNLPEFDAHAFVSKLDRCFTVWELPGRKALDDFLAGCPRCVAYGIVLPNLILGITLDCKPENVLSSPVSGPLGKLPVVVLHDLVLGQILGITPEATARESNLAYVKNEQEVFDAVGSGAVQLGIVLKPTRVEDVIEVAGSGEVMPQKSTWFYPKIMTGLVFRSLEGSA